jgi:hypothetical protein
MLCKSLIDKMFTSAALNLIGFRSGLVHNVTSASGVLSMKPFRFFAPVACVLVLAMAALAGPHECNYSTADSRLENAKLQADFNVHRASIESRAALGQLQVAEKVAARLHKQHLLNADEYSARLKEIEGQQHAVRVHMLKSQIAAFESVLGINSEDSDSLTAVRKLRAALQTEERAAGEPCPSGSNSGRSVAD